MTIPATQGERSAIRESHHASEGMADDEYALRVSAGVISQQARCRTGIVDRFAVDSQPTHVRHLAAVCVGALVVGQHGNAFARQSHGQVAERFVRADGFIPVVRSRTMHQHHCRHRLGAFGQVNSAREFPFRIAEGHLLGRKRCRIGISRRLPLMCLDRKNEKAGDFVVGVKHHLDVEHGVSEHRAHEHCGVRPRLLDARVHSASERRQPDR